MNFTFLNAAFLFGALAALLQLIIHLFSRRRVETVDFSSLRFLRELERRKIRRVRIRQILLLVVRSLIILFVALALARPTLSGALAGGRSHARTSVAIVLDESGSMARDGARGTLLDEAIAVAARVVDLLDEGDQAFLVTCAAPPRSVLAGGTFSRGTLVESLDELEPTAAATEYADAVRLGLELLDGARNLNRELYLVGDMQRSGWTGPVLTAGGSGSRGSDGAGGSDGERASSGKRAADGGPSAYVFPLEGPVGNLFISDVATERRYGGTAGRIAVTAQVKNGSRRRAKVPVRLFVDGVQVGRSGVDLSPGEHGTAQFSVALDESAWHSGWAELPDDALEIDNRRYFVVPPRLTTEVLIVQADGELDRGDAYYTELALDPSGNAERFSPSVVPLSDLIAQDQGRFPAVVLADVGRLDAGASAWLARHVETGGGLVIILGDRTDVRAWNEGEVPGSSVLVLREPFEREAGVRLAPASRGHPLTDGLVVGERLIDDIAVTRGFAADLEGGEEILEFPGIGPALTVARGPGGEHAGEVAVLLTAIDPHWNDLPRSGFLVPLLHRIVREVSGGAARRGDVLVGEGLEVILADGAAGRIEVTLPDGTTATPEHRAGSRAVVALAAATLPGIHTFSMNGTVVALGVVNVDPVESDLSPADPQEIGRHLEGIAHRFIDPSGDIGAGILEARHGRELWRLFVYGALALLAFEMYLARQRTG